MTGSTTSTSIAVLLLVPFWWALALMLLALAADLEPRLRPRLFRWLDRIGRTVPTASPITSLRA